jgi:hypothetical protein
MPAPGMNAGGALFRHAATPVLHDVFELAVVEEAGANAAHTWAFNCFLLSYGPLRYP